VDSVASVERGSARAAEAGKAMDELVASVKRVGHVFDNLTADSSEHAQGIDVVTASVRELDGVTRQNVHTAERSGDIAHELQVQAAKLAEVLGAFRLGDDQAVATLRDTAQAAVALSAAQRERNQRERAGAAAGGASEGVEFF
jgi:hypothetical protein